MEIFFYQSPLEVPFATPYSREFFTDKQVLLISNKSEILGEFETHRAAIMEDGITKIIGIKVFVPVVVKTVFLTWLKAEYSNIDWPAKTEFADFRPEVTDELQAFFQQLQIVEKREGGTMQRNELVEQDDNKFAEATADASKYVSMGFAIIVVLSLLISLISLKSSGDVRQSQVEYALKMAYSDQAKETDKLHRCSMLAQFFRSELQKTGTENVTQYNQTCQPSQTQPVQPLSADDKKKQVDTSYQRAKPVLSSQDFVFLGNTDTEEGSALWYAKAIWDIDSNEAGYQKVEEILSSIISGYNASKVIKLDAKCKGIQKVYEFSCRESQLKVTTEKIKTTFPACTLTCPSTSTTGK